MDEKMAQNHDNQALSEQVAATETENPQENSLLLYDAGEDVAGELELALNGRKKTLTKKQKLKIIIPSVAVLAAAAVLVAYFAMASSNTAGEEVAAYRESAVTRGNLTVGITETGTVGVGTQNASAEFAADIVEVYVKAGQEVAEGDAIALLDTSSIETEITSLQTAYDSAVLSYSNAVLNRQAASVEASYEYQTNQAKSSTALSEYNNTVQRLQNAYDTAYYNYNTAVNNIATLESEISVLQSYIDQGYNTEAELAAAQAAAASQAAAATEETQTEESTVLAETVAESSSASSSSTSSKTFAEQISSKQTELSSLNASLASLSLAISEADLAYTTGKLAAEEKYAAAMNEYNNSGTIYNVATSEVDLQVQQAKITMDEAEEALAEAQALIADPVVYAPCAGLVQSISYSAGDSVMANQALAVITDASNVYVTVSISQDDIADITIGKAVNLSFTAYEETFTGEVDSIATTAAREGASTVSYTVTIAVNGDTTSLYSGMTGDVTFITKQIEDVLYVSNNAITTENGVSYVKVLAEDGSFVKTEVVTGFSDGRNVEISSGLTEADVVIIEMEASNA